MPIQNNRAVVEKEASSEEFERCLKEARRKFHTKEEIAAELRRVIPDFDRIIERARIAAGTSIPE